MTAPPRWLLVLAAVLILGGLAAPHVPRPDVPFVTPTKHEGAYLLVVEENVPRTQASAVLIDDMELQKELKDAGFKGPTWHDIGEDTTKPEWEAAFKRIHPDGKGAVLLIIDDDTRQELGCADLPNDREGICKIIQKATGVKWN